MVLTIILFLSCARLNIFSSASQIPICPSYKQRTMSASSIAALDCSIPMFSTLSGLLSLIPAVSIRVALMPFISSVSVIVSRVVPSISVTIARLRFKSVLKRDDLPAFGLPATAIFIPCLKMLCIFAFFNMSFISSIAPCTSVIISS